MSVFSKGLVAAMEDETQQAELAIDETGAESAEADIVEATDISADVEAGTAEVEQAQTDADTLTRIADTAEAAEADGGLDPVAAEITEIAVEAIYARLGVKKSHKYPALESFSGKTGRARATAYAIEDIKETVKKIWAAVVGAFQKIIDFVKNFFGKLFDANKKLKARINALNQKNSSAKEDYKGKVKASGIGKAFGSSEKSGILTGAKSAAQELEVLHAWGVSASGSLGKISEDLSRVLTIQRSGKEQSALDEAKTIQDFYKEAVSLKNVSAGKHVIGPRIEVQVEAGKGAGKAAWEAVASFGATIKDNIPFTEKEELDALNRKEVGDILAAADDIVDKNLDQKAVVAAIERSVTEVINTAKKMQSMVPAGDEDAGTLASDSRVGQRAIQNAGNTIIKVVTAGGKIGMNCAKAAIDYAERSMNAKGGSDSSDDSKNKDDKK